MQLTSLLNNKTSSTFENDEESQLVPGGEEDVLSFEVSVDDLVLVQVAQGRSHLEEYLSRPRLWIFALEYLRSYRFLS